ncbi:unnamed protein product, partial [Scytosiphon promiscuus]
MENGERDALFGQSSSRRSASPTAPPVAVAAGTGQGRMPQRQGGGRTEVGGDDGRFGGEPEGGGYGGGGSGGGSGGGGGWDANRRQQQTSKQQQQQQQQMSWMHVRDSIDLTARRRGLRSAYESVEVGRETLERLDDQKERLERSEMVLDSTRYAIERSARVLRGMTFWGKIKNAFTDDPQIPRQENGRSAAGATAAGVPRPSEHDSDETGATTASTGGGYGALSGGGGTGGGGDHQTTPLEGFICPDCRKTFLAAEALVAHFGSTH